MKFKAFVASSRSLLAGLLLCALISAVAFVIDKQGFGKQFGFSMLTVAIIVGMLIGNSIYPLLEPKSTAGIDFAKSKLLRLGIILYGFRLTFSQLAEVGLGAIIIDVLIVFSTFALTVFLALKILRIDKVTAILIGAGCAICGAAAIMATAPLLRAKSAQITVAVAVIVVFGSIGIFLYPYLYQLQLFDLSDRQFGIYIGASVHEVAQVVAAANNINQEIADNAVIVKMIRVMLLAPFLLLLAWYLSRQQPNAARAIYIPWFALWFIAMIGFNSWALLPPKIVAALVFIDDWLLAMAMAALGVSTHLNAIKQAGSKPFLLGVLVMVYLVLAAAVATGILA